MPFLTVPDGTRLYYEEMGAGDPLLLISGNGRDHRDWNKGRDDFTDRYRVIVSNHRGIGQSDKPSAPPYSIQGFAHDAIALLDHLGIAQRLAISHPEHVGAVVLAATAPSNPVANTQGHAVSRTAEAEALMTHLPTDPEQALKQIQLTIYSPVYLEAHLELIQAEL